MSFPHSELPPPPPDDEIAEIPQSSDAPRSAARPRRSSGGLGLAVAVILGGLTAVGAFFGIKASGLLDPAPAPVAESPSAIQEMQQAGDEDSPDGDAHSGTSDDNSSANTAAISIPGREPPRQEKKIDANAPAEPHPVQKPDTVAKETPKVEPIQSSTANAPKRAPQPSAAALKAANATLDEVYGERIRKARTFEEKSAVAKSLLNAARTEQAGTPLQFALFDRAGRLAVEAAFPRLADEVFAAFGDAFDVDLMPRRADAVEAWMSIAFKELKGEQEVSMQRVLAQRAADIAGRAWSQKRFGIALSMLTRAQQLRDAAGDRELAKKLIQKKALARKLTDWSEKADALYAELQSDPDNPDTNLAAGLAFAEAHRWDRACECFAKGSDQPLKNLADESRRLEAKPDLAAAGDLWWDAAGSAAKDRRDWMRERAVGYYESVVDRLQGLQREKVVGRMKTVGPVDFALPDPIVRFTFDRSDVVLQANSGRVKNRQGDYFFGALRGGTRVDGAFDEGLQFNGLNQNVVCPGTEETVGLQPAFTLTTFVRVDSYGDYNIAGKFYDLFRDSAYDFGVRMNRSGTITAMVRGEKGSIRLQDTAEKFPLGSWHHFAMTWDGKTLTTYVDGVAAETGRANQLTVAKLSTRYPFAVAGGNGLKSKTGGGPHSLKGAVDEMRIYLQSLTPAMIVHVALGADL